jgi:hypothetical protein
MGEKAKFDSEMEINETIRKQFFQVFSISKNQNGF